MKTKLTILTAVLSLCAITVRGQEEGKAFPKGEWQLSPYLTYVDKVDDKWGLGASATYFVTDMIGVGGSTYWTDFGGTFIDNLAGEARFRLPILKRLAPYAVGSIGYQFDSKEWFETLGAGIDFKAFKRFSAFSDLQWRFANETKDGVFLRIGLRFSLGSK